MITKGYIDSGDFYKLTRQEAIAFVIFELKEKMRHENDIGKIRNDIKTVCRIFGIQGIELNGIYITALGGGSGKKG